MIQKKEYLQYNELQNATTCIEEDSSYHRLGSPRQPERFYSIDYVEYCYKFKKLHLAIQSWVHNYLQGRIGKHGRLKRVKRCHLPKLPDAYVSTNIHIDNILDIESNQNFYNIKIKLYNCIMIQLIDHYDIDKNGIQKQIA